MSDNRARDVVRRLAIQLAPKRIELVPFYEDELCKAGLVELLQAGQDMRDTLQAANQFAVLQNKWDEARKRVIGESPQRKLRLSDFGPVGPDLGDF